LSIFLVAGQAASCLDRLRIACKDGDAISALLPLPDCAVTSGLQRAFRKLVRECFEFLR
jgi:hypothetical protein